MPTISRRIPFLWPALAGYVLLAFVLSAVLVVAQGGTPLSTDLVAIVQFGPALAVLVLWLAARRRLAPLLPASVPGRRVLGRTALVVGAAALLGVLFAAGFAATGHRAHGIGPVGGVPFGIYLLVQLVGAAGEEIGWRGLMQPLLEKRFRRVVAAVVTGVVWAAWHVQVFAAGPAVALSFFVATVATAVLLGFVANGSFWQRVVTAAAGHWGLNVAMHTVCGETTNQAPQAYLIALAAIVTTAVVVLPLAIAGRSGRG